MGHIIKYAMDDNDEEQAISPLSIMIKCIAILYKAMHNLGPFQNQNKLSRAMQTRVTLFLANEEWDVTCILDLKIEGPIEHVCNPELHLPIKTEAPMSAMGDPPIPNMSDPNRCLVGHKATPGPTPELSTISNHHLKVLSSLNERMQWEEHELLDPRVISVHAWRCKIFTMLSVVPFVRRVLDRKATTFEDANVMLSSIVMQSFSNMLHTEYFAKHRDQPVLIAIDLFDWALKKCTVHSNIKEYELLAVTLDLHWDQVGSHTYDFLIKWEAHVLELHEYLKDPWMPDYHYRTLKHALPSGQNALFNSVFILHEKVHGRDQTIASISNVLHQCYELAAKNSPTTMQHRRTTEESELVALRAATLINCWACGELGHAANCCPNDAAHICWKEGKVKVPPKGCTNTCIVLPLEIS
ncbi:hypothetical protein NDA11_001309 [Ustilago hordei]|nr:hypothetical protein NDA12_004805 [Ustilago hordei]KAJ1592753.1 hypothetical protein NDA11_001309 [Ustilago hordei]